MGTSNLTPPSTAAILEQGARRGRLQGLPPSLGHCPAGLRAWAAWDAARIREDFANRSVFICRFGKNGLRGYQVLAMVFTSMMSWSHTAP